MRRELTGRFASYPRNLLTNLWATLPRWTDGQAYQAFVTIAQKIGKVSNSLIYKHLFVVKRKQNVTKEFRELWRDRIDRAGRRCAQLCSRKLQNRHDGKVLADRPAGLPQTLPTFPAPGESFGRSALARALQLDADSADVGVAADS